MQGKSKNFNSKGRFIKNENKDEKTVVRDKDKIYSEAKNKIKKENILEVNGSKENSQVEEREDIVIGRNAVIEALRGERTIETLYISNSII